MNGVEFLVSVCVKVIEFNGEGSESDSVDWSVSVKLKVVLKAESDVGGGLNDSLKNLCDVFVFDGEKVVASRGLLEASKRHGV